MKTSAITFGRFDVAAVMFCYAAFLCIWVLALWPQAQSRPSWVFLLGIAAAALQALWHFTLIRKRERDGCFKAFRLNHWLGFAVFAGIVLASTF